MPVYVPPIDFDLATAYVIPPGYYDAGNGWITTDPDATPVWTYDGYVVDLTEFYEFAVDVTFDLFTPGDLGFDDRIDFEIRMAPATGTPQEAWDSGDQALAGNVTVIVEGMGPGPFTISADIGPGINSWDVGAANGWSRLFFSARWASDSSVFTRVTRNQLIGVAGRTCLRNVERSADILFKHPDGSWSCISLVGV